MQRFVCTTFRLPASTLRTTHPSPATPRTPPGGPASTLHPTGCRFTVDGKQLISWSHDTTIRLWDLAQAREANTLSGHTDRVTCLALSTEGRFVVSGGRD